MTTSESTVDVADEMASTLANLVADLQLQDVPEVISLRARHLMLDAIGCALAARNSDFAQLGVSAVSSLDGASAAGADAPPVFGFAQRLPLRDAMLLNGLLCHGLDYDDTHVEGIIHLSVSLVPAVLALGSRQRMSGRQVLLAYVAALEAGARIASVAKGGFHAKGFHPTGIVGAFASALACGKLMGLDGAGLLRAQGIALSMASGSLQFLKDGAWTKRVHPGWAAQAGYHAAHFALHGLPAPRAPFSGEFGLYANFMTEASAKDLDLSIGTAGIEKDGRIGRWETPNVAVKPFPICHLSHASADCAIALHAAGCDVSSIERVDVLVPAGTMPIIAAPEAAKRKPGTDYEAKFSVHYAVASGLLRGRLGLPELSPEAFADERAVALMQRIHCVADPATTFPRHYTGEVRVLMRDGRQLAHRESVNRGHAERPLTNEDVKLKFMENASIHFSQAHAEALCAAVLGIDQLDRLDSLDSLLATAPEI